MLNIAGPEFDYGHVVFAVLQECEHRRRSLDEQHFEKHVAACARAKLAEIRAAYDELSGSTTYWEALEKEVMEVAIPQYADAAEEMNERERESFGLFHNGDVSSRFLYGLIGLLVGSAIIALPFIPIVEKLFAFALTGIGCVYPDLKRWWYEQRHAAVLNHLVAAAEKYQSDSRLHYMTTEQITKSLTPGGE